MQSNNTELSADITSLLTDSYLVGEVEVEGQSISFLKKCLRERGWKFRGDRMDFEILVESAGFVIVDGRNKRRGTPTQIVTTKTQMESLTPSEMVRYEKLKHLAEVVWQISATEYAEFLELNTRYLKGAR